MFSQLLFALALVAPSIAVAVSGKAPGFASGTTGGSAGQTVTPTTTSELTKYLTAKEPLTIVLTKAFDYRGSEGTASGTGCAPWGELG
jgi:pectin lyase